MSTGPTQDVATEERIRECGRRFALRFSRAVASMRTFSVQHPSMRAPIEGVADALTDLTTLVGEAEVEIEVDSVRTAGLRTELEGSQHRFLRELYRFLSRRDSRSFRISDRVEPDHVRVLLRAMDDIGGRAPAEARDFVNQALVDAGIRHILVEAGAGGIQRRPEELAAPEERLLVVWLELARLAEDALTEGARAGTLRATEDVLPELVDLLLAQPAMGRVLVQDGPPLAYEARHVANTTVLGVLLGQRLGLDRELLVDLAACIVGMDLGMVVLPVDVRRAPRELTDRELDALRTHPIESVRIHLRERVLDATVRRRLRVAFEQHLGVDRTGYPEVQRWPELHLFSRIASVVDAYDALSSDSPWRRGLSPEQALAQLCPPTDKSHDPALVAELCATLGIFPRHVRVRLSTGEMGKVVDLAGPHGLPVVRTDGGAQVTVGAPTGAGGRVAVVAVEISRQAAHGG